LAANSSKLKEHQIIYLVLVAVVVRVVVVVVVVDDVHIVVAEVISKIM